MKRSAALLALLTSGLLLTSLQPQPGADTKAQAVGGTSKASTPASQAPTVRTARARQAAPAAIATPSGHGAESL